MWGQCSPLSSLESSRERHSRVVQTVGERLIHNQANSYWRKNPDYQEGGKAFKFFSLLDFRETFMVYGPTVGVGEFTAY